MKSFAFGACPWKLALVTEPCAAPTPVSSVDFAPLPAIVPATCVPWPSVSVRRLVWDPTVDTRLVVRSGWVQSMPESLMLMTMLLPVRPSKATRLVTSVTLPNR